MLTFRNAYIAIASQDTLAVVEAIVEFERLASFAPNMRVYRDLCQAYVALNAGHAQEALAIHERCAALPDAHLRPAYEVFTALHAETLVELGRVEEAKRLCEEGLRVREAQGIPSYALRGLQQALAVIEARCADFARAKQLLEEVAQEVAATGAPLSIGSVHRDRARVALLEQNAGDFARYFEAMLAAYQPTRNPSLLQQCRKLLAEAERLGVAAAPSWEKHELLPANDTQDIHATVPEITELI